jgi:hypothetical protein
MLTMNALLAYKEIIGWAAGLVAATMTVAIFQSIFGLDWFIAIPAGVLAYVTIFIMWVRYVSSLEHQRPRR